MYRLNSFVDLNTKAKNIVQLISSPSVHTLSDVKCERSSICRMAFSLASRDCNKRQLFNALRV